MTCRQSFASNNMLLRGREGLMDRTWRQAIGRNSVDVRFGTIFFFFFLPEMVEEVVNKIREAAKSDLWKLK